MADAGVMKGKRGLVMGVANDHSIAWGIARTLHAHGAEVAFTYQGDAQLKRLKPLADSIGAKIVMPCDVEDDNQMDAAFDVLILGVFYKYFFNKKFQIYFQIRLI